MQEQPMDERERRIAERVRDACVRALLDGYENASMSGLCHEGAFEVAVGNLREMDPATLLHDPGGEPGRD